MLCSGLFLEIGKFIVEHHRKREALEMVLEKVESHEELAVQGMTLRAARTDDIEAAVDLFNAAAESLIGVADKFSVEDNQQNGAPSTRKNCVPEKISPPDRYRDSPPE